MTTTCSANPPKLSTDDLANLRASLHPDWQTSEDDNSISRHFTFKGFAKANLTANTAAFLSDQTGHHADIAFGWGCCTVTHTTYEADRLSEADFTCAEKLDAMLA